MVLVTGWNDTAREFLKSIVTTPGSLAALTSDPDGTAAGLGYTLSPAFRDQLARLSANLRATSADPADPEVDNFFRRVILDGRYVSNWAADPQTVAGSLGLTLSPRAVQAIKMKWELASPILPASSGDLTASWVAIVAVAIAVVIVFPAGQAASAEALVFQPDDLRAL